MKLTSKHIQKHDRIHEEAKRTTINFIQAEDEEEDINI